nr:hypothetical protein [Tanacetum cinerariifolium]
MIQVKEMMQDKDLKNSKSKDEGSRSRSQRMNDQSHYKQAKAKSKINKATSYKNVIGRTITVSLSYEGPISVFASFPELPLSLSELLFSFSDLLNVVSELLFSDSILLLLVTTKLASNA